MGYQIPVRVYAGVVGIAPKELQRIVAHLHVVKRVDVLRHRLGVKPGLPSHLVDATGAGAAEAKVPMRIRAAVPIIP